MRPVFAGIPRGYAVHRIGATWLVLDTSFRRDLVELRLADPETRENLFARAQRRGRGRAPTVHLPSQSSLVLRRYRHGGLLGWLTGVCLIGPRRALWELEITVRAERSGAPVPHVACVAVWPIAGPFWSALIGTVEIEDGKDLQSWLSSAEERRDRVALARRVGLSIRRLHDAGIEHRDLQLRNILVRSDASTHSERVVVIDLDGATHHGVRGVPLVRRARNLGRLARSAIKLGLWGGAVGRRERAAFLAGYFTRDRKLRAALRRFVLRERAKLLWHRAGYWLRSSGSASSTSMTGMPSSIG